MAEDPKAKERFEGEDADEEHPRMCSMNLYTTSGASFMSTYPNAIPHTLVHPHVHAHHVNRSITWELPRNVPYDAKTILFKRFVGLWPEPTGRCFHEVRGILDAEVNKLLSVHFSRFRRLEIHIGYAERYYTPMQHC